MNVIKSASEGRDRNAAASQRKHQHNDQKSFHLHDLTDFAALRKRLRNGYTEIQGDCPAENAKNTEKIRRRNPADLFSILILRALRTSVVHFSIEKQFSLFVW